MPRPWQASTTSNATSADRGSSSSRTKRAVPTTAPVTRSVATTASRPQQPTSTKSSTSFSRSAASGRGTQAARPLRHPREDLEDGRAIPTVKTSDADQDGCNGCTSRTILHGRRLARPPRFRAVVALHDCGGTDNRTLRLAEVLGLAEEAVDLVGEEPFVRDSSSAASRARSRSFWSLRSRTKRRSEKPDWRAPRSWPSPRISRSRSASSKPSVVSTIASRRSAASSVSSSLGRETSRQYDCSAPRPTRPRSWWSCARPKRSASCTIITVAFGTSTPTSITVVATSTSSSPRLEPRHELAPVGGLELPVQAADAEVAELVLPQALGLVLGRPRAARLRLLDERADDVRLPALAQEAVSRVYASDARSSGIQRVITGLRFAGSTVSSLTSRSP